ATREPTETSRSATRNYELDRTLQHTRQPPGRIRRVTAAVLVDHVPRPGPDGATVLQPPSDAELQRVEALVRQAVGFDEQRGDGVSAMRGPFVPGGPGAGSPPRWWKLPRVRASARLLLGAVVAPALLCGVVPAAIRQRTGPGPARERAATRGARAEVIEDEV